MHFKTEATKHNKSQSNNTPKGGKRTAVETEVAHDSKTTLENLQTKTHMKAKRNLTMAVTKAGRFEARSLA